MSIYWIEFEHPWFFVLLILIPVLIFFEYRQSKKWVNFGPIELLVQIYWGNSFWWYFWVIIRASILFVIITILATPWYSNIKKQEIKKWIDISIVLDISKSMLAEDIKPNRIEAAKKVIWDFVNKIESDRISFTLFAWKPFVSIPLTFDYQNVLKYIKSISTDSIMQEVPWLSWTAIWDWIMAWTDSLTTEKTKEKREKVMILLTDWEANMWIDPRIALKYAKDKNIKIYTIWIWKPEWTELYVTDKNWNKIYFRWADWIPIKATLDEILLWDIAKSTSWEYYNAQSQNTLASIFEDLSKLNKTEIETKTMVTFNANYTPLLQILLVLLTVNIILINKYKFR